MGYRFVLRKFTYPRKIKPGGKLTFTSWWDNKGVAPCYKDFALALRLTNEKKAQVLPTQADIRTWLPGDNLYDDSITLPPDLPAGKYTLQLGIIDRAAGEPKIQLAIAGKTPDGWYPMGPITLGK
jgi:hypothetical protein